MQRLVRVQNAEARPTPSLVLADLRLIDPTAELVYAGEGTWWLGTVRTNEERRKRGERILQMESARSQQNVRNVMLAHLLLEGFARIEAYDGPDPSGVMLCRKGCRDQYHTTIVEDFRARDFEWRRDQGKQKFDDSMALSLGDAKKAAADAEFKHYLATDGRAHYRREVRGRIQSGHGGIVGGPGKIITL